MPALHLSQWIRSVGWSDLWRIWFTENQFRVSTLYVFDIPCSFRKENKCHFVRNIRGAITTCLLITRVASRDDDMSQRLFVLSLDAFRVHCRTWCFLPCSPFLFVSSISGWLSAKLYHQLTSYPCPSSCPLYPLFVHYPCMWLSPSISVPVDVLSLGGQEEREEGHLLFPFTSLLSEERDESLSRACIYAYFTPLFLAVERNLPSSVLSLPCVLCYVVLCFSSFFYSL